MSNHDTVSLPACAFGAGLVHILALAFILPVVITLPAPGADLANGAVAIQVAILNEPPTEAEGDAEDMLAPPSALASQDITAALPEPEAIPEEVTQPAMDENETEVQAETVPTVVANVEPEEEAVAVPLPLRKPKVVDAAESPEAKAKSAPKPRVSAESSPRAPARPKPVVKKGFLGGSPATGGYEYPVPGRMPGSG